MLCIISFPVHFSDRLDCLRRYIQFCIYHQLKSLLTGSTRSIVQDFECLSSSCPVYIPVEINSSQSKQVPANSIAFGCFQGDSSMGFSTGVTAIEIKQFSLSNINLGDRRTYRHIFILILWHDAGRPTPQFCTRMARKKSIAT